MLYAVSKNQAGIWNVYGRAPKRPDGILRRPFVCDRAGQPSYCLGVMFSPDALDQLCGEFDGSVPFLRGIAYAAERLKPWGLFRRFNRFGDPFNDRRGSF